MDPVVGATIQVVLQTLLSASIEEIKLVFGFKKDLEKLKDSLLMIQDFLHDAEMKQFNNKAVKRWLEKLEDVAFEADAVLDECNYELLRQKVKKQKPASKKVLRFLPSGSKGLLYRRKMVYKIEKVNNNLDAINKEARSFGLQMIAMSSDHASSSVGFDLPPTDSLSVEPQIVGRDIDESKVVEMLLSAPNDEIVSVLPILGMGGLGKTTLARKVFHHVKIGAHFEKRIWVCVSTNFDSITLFKMILESLSRENVQVILTKEVVLEKIREHLASKRYLLVLDDVWNENSKQWDDFMSSLLGISDAKGNCIVVTTRKENVASLVGTLSTYQPESLSNADCWSIIKLKAFSRVDVPTEFKEVGQCIGQRCGGLPLVAKVVGGLLRGKSINEWQLILRDQLLKFCVDDETVMNILKLSYDRLPSSAVKKCFAYCSVFPQDYPIRKQAVIELWMAEGFLQAGRGRDTETLGDEIFNFLLQNSLFQDAEKDKYGNIIYCTMHDLVHDLACSVSGSRTITTENGISGGLHQARYIAMKSIGEESFAILKQHAKSLRTIFLEGKIVDMFVGFKQLHVLKLMGDKIEELPEEIGELIHLRLLEISRTRISYLPDSIGKLYNLQTLLVSSSYQFQILKRLPKTVVDLISLRHLHTDKDTELPPWMGKLTCLQTLPSYKVGHEHGFKIGELRNLNNLKGFLDIRNIEKVKDKEEAHDANLFRKSCIFGLVLEWSESREGEVNDESVLDGLEPHSGLKSLRICWYKSKNFPSWTMKMAVQAEIDGCREVLRNLIEITLENCKECEKVPMFGHLPHLKCLKLSGMDNVRSIGISFYGYENVSTSSMNGSFREPMTVFPALEDLRFMNMPELSEWAEAEAGITVFPCLKYLKVAHCPKLNNVPSQFPCLEHLKIESCTKLKGVPSHLPCLKELRVIDVTSDFCLADACRSTGHLESIEIGSLPELISLPDDLSAKNQNLRKLRIESCPKLMRLVLCSPGGGVSSLHELWLSDCPELESISYVKGLASLQRLRIESCGKLREPPLDLYSLRFLEELYISGCPELKSIFVPYANSSKQQGMIITSSLRELVIHNCSGLIDLPIELFQSCSSSLQDLTLARIPKLMNFPITEICCLNRSLRHLSIGGFSDSVCFKSFNKHLSQLFQGRHLSLVSLHLYGKEDWDSLPHQVQHLTALRELHLYDFGTIEALPEWMGNLSSLEWLWIQNCKTLRLLPSKEAIRRLTRLDYLSIQDCQLLGERCRKQESTTSTTTSAADASEWPKISHINHVYINCKSLLFNFKRLTHLHSKEFMHRLTKLYTLYISECPLLEERLRNHERVSSVHCFCCSR